MNPLAVRMMMARARINHLAPPPSTPTLIQQSASPNDVTPMTFTFAQTPKAGDSLLIVYVQTQSNLPAAPAGWAVADYISVSGDYVVWLTRTADGTETSVTCQSGDTDKTSVLMQEWSPGATFSGFFSASQNYTADGSNSQLTASFAAPSAISVPSAQFLWVNASPAGATWPSAWTGIVPPGTGYPYDSACCGYGPASDGATSCVLTFPTRGTSALVGGCWVS